MSRDARLVSDVSAALEVEKLTAGYSLRTEIVREVSLEVAHGEMVGVLGANGAGKSSLLKAIAGLCPVRSGLVRLSGRELQGRRCSQRVAAGLVLVPQGYALFHGLSVAENLAMGAWHLRGSAHAKRMAEGYAMLPRLYERRRQPVDALSGGERAMLAIARGVLSGPTVLLLDEPSLGLSPSLRAEVLSTVKGWCREGRLSCLVAEQDVTTLATVADRWLVIRTGRIVYTGVPGELPLSSLRDVYLGLEPVDGSEFSGDDGTVRELQEESRRD